MAKAAAQFDAAIDKKLKEFADAQSRSRKNAVPIIFGDNGEGDPKLNFGDLCAKAAQKQFSAIEKSYSKLGVHINSAGNGFVLSPTSAPIRKKAAMGESSGVTGGYTVPPDFYNQLLAIIEESTFIRQHAFVQPMASASTPVPLPRHHHGPGRRHLAFLRRRADELDGRGPDPHRDRAAVQDDGAQGLRAVRLLASAPTSCCRTPRSAWRSS